MPGDLAAYLHDHLAGSNFAIELLNHLRDRHENEPLGHFAAAELTLLEQDRQIVQTILTSLGAEPSSLKEAVTWVAEKASRLKLSRATSGEFGTFQALETLAVGIMGRVSLWRVLSVIAPSDARVHGPDFDALAAAAQAQHDRVHARCLQLAPTALQS